MFRSAQLPRMTVGNILNDTHPRPERFGQLLRALDDATARQWLTAYLRDDCPPEYLPRLEIIIAGKPQHAAGRTQALDLLRRGQGDPRGREPGRRRRRIQCPA